ncbi:hypothetical protein CR513_40167, partial [Mucuna pruriens]
MSDPYQAHSGGLTPLYLAISSRTLQLCHGSRHGRPSSSFHVSTIHFIYRYNAFSSLHDFEYKPNIPNNQSYELEQMENNNRTLKELPTPDVLYQPWCIEYPQLEPA